METSVIVTNYNGKHYLQDCIDALLKQKVSDFEIILVDNNSTDGSLVFVRQRYAKIIPSKLRIIGCRTNTGFAQGNNIGVKAAKGKYAVLLNNDTRVDPQWLGELIAPLREHERIALTVSREKLADPVWRKRILGHGGTLTLAGEPVHCGKRETYGPGVTDMFFVSGNGVAFRKKDIPKPFDDDYFAYAEDAYLSWWQQLKGKDAVWCTRATMFHHGSGTKNQSKRLSEFAIFHGTKNQVMNYLIFYEWKNVIRVAPIFLVTQVAHTIFDPLRIPTKIRAYWWTLTHLRSILRKRSAMQRQRRLPDKDVVRNMSCKLFADDYLPGRAKNAAIKTANSVFYAYCWATCLRTREFYEKRSAKRD